MLQRALKWIAPSIMAVAFVLWPGTNTTAQYLDSLYAIWQDKTLPDTVRMKAFDDYIWDGFMYGKFDSALLLSGRLQSFAAAAGSPWYESRALNYQGVALFEQGDVIGALDRLHASLRIAEREANQAGMASALTNIARVEMNLGSLDAAWEHQSRALELRKLLGDEVGEVLCLQNLGNIRFNLKDMEGSEEIGKRAYEKSLVIGDAVGAAYACTDIGISIFLAGRKAEALPWFEQALERSREIHDPMLESLALSRLSMHAFDRGDHDRAVTLGNNALHLAKEVNSWNPMRDAAKVLHASYKAKGDLANALHMHELWSSLQDSLLNTENIRSAAQAGVRYAANARIMADSLEFARRESIATSEIKRRSQQRNWALVSAGLISLLAISFIRRRRQERRIAAMEVQRLEQEKVIAELTIREQVGRDMHDDLGAGLSALRLRSEMAQRNEPDPDKREQFAAMARQAEELVTNMRQLIWSMTTEEGDLPGTVDHCVRYARGYAAENGLKTTLQVESEMPPLPLAPHQRRNLFLTLKEALHNVVKHAEAKEVRMRFAWSEKQGELAGLLKVDIQDDGRGVQPSGSGDGRGLTNMRKRIEELGGTITIRSENGTRIHIELPLGGEPR